MPPTDRSVTILTGMIIAALYVVLLVGVARESYMRREARARAEFLTTRPAAEDASKRICRIEQVCALSP